MIQLTFEPLVTNATVWIIAGCEPDDVAGEFLPSVPNSVSSEPIRANYTNDKPKGTKRSGSVAEENLVRCVDIYPKDPLTLKQQIEIGTEVRLQTEAYGSEDGYLEGIQFFDGNNLIKLCICLGKQ